MFDNFKKFYPMGILNLPTNNATIFIAIFKTDVQIWNQCLDSIIQKYWSLLTYWQWYGQFG